MPSDSPAIETRQLVKQFDDKRAVDGLDLRVESGVFFGLLGPNGAGKSTTVGMLTGTSRPSAGQIFLFGQKLDPDDPDFKRQMGVVTEEPPLFERLKGREQLLFTGRMYGLAQDEAARRSDELLDLMQLGPHGSKLIADYSRGMRKKLAIACALIHAPRLLFFDEPFEGVDALSAEAIRLVLEGLTERGATVLLTTHILEVAQKICQRVGIIHRGKLVSELDVVALREEGGDLGELFRAAVGGEHDNRALPDWLCPGQERP
ncbi:MAG: ABC transporter ATP-binding protein [Deltaproteobacteria bacterium]|nr:ABC transporter ATP-binding protein [Deltaproteobacteria bacterium]